MCTIFEHDRFTDKFASFRTDGNRVTMLKVPQKMNEDLVEMARFDARYAFESRFACN